jgi:hypothetical protein
MGYIFMAVLFFFLVFGVRRPAEQNEKGRNNEPNLPHGGNDIM